MQDSLFCSHGSPVSLTCMNSTVQLASPSFLLPMIVLQTLHASCYIQIQNQLHLQAPPLLLHTRVFINNTFLGKPYFTLTKYRPARILAKQEGSLCPDRRGEKKEKRPQRGVSSMIHTYTYEVYMVSNCPEGAFMAPFFSIICTI